MIPFTFLQEKRQITSALSVESSGSVSPDSHGEVGDERPFGDVHVEADALRFGARIDHGALVGGVSEAGRDAALHLVALDGDVVSTDGLCRKEDR